MAETNAATLSALITKHEAGPSKAWMRNRLVGRLVGAFHGHRGALGADRSPSADRNALSRSNWHFKQQRDCGQICPSVVLR